MGSIRLLSDIVASQVAAGEVVERPASVVKELVENSIDAGATKIVVEFLQGGRELLRIIDNGSGMDREDALRSLERHATSKIRTAEDLDHVTTLGFRGEALPSVASVSRFHLKTVPRGIQGGAQEGEVLCGTELTVTGGVVEECSDTGGAVGTTIEVRDLFFNVPVRRKFLKSITTESYHILSQLQSLAIAYPSITMICQKDHHEVFQLPATHDLAVRIKDLFGYPFLERLEQIPSVEAHGIKVFGFLAKPGEGTKDRSQQFFFVNGRRVFSPMLSAPLREAYDGILAKGLHPLAVLFLDIPLEEIDCNVHPTKREVRFQKPGHLREAIAKATATIFGKQGAAWEQENFLQQNSQKPEALKNRFLEKIKTTSNVQYESLVGGKRLEKYQQTGPQSPQEVASTSALVEEHLSRSFPSKASHIFHQVPSLSSEQIAGGSSSKIQPSLEREQYDRHDDFQESLQKEKELTDPLDSLEDDLTTLENQKDQLLPTTWLYLGVLAGRYLLFEEEGALILVKVTAALERITYDTMKASLASGAVERQRLLLPEIFEFSPAEAEWLLAASEELAQAGFELHDFGSASSYQDGTKERNGGKSLKLDTVPVLISSFSAEDLRALLAELVTQLAQEIKHTVFSDQAHQVVQDRFMEEVALSVSRRAGHTHFFPQSEQEALLFLKDLLKRELPYKTPLGKPTMIQWTPQELLKKFR